MKLNFRNKNKGFTLVEILLVVGFIALASIGVYTIYSKVQLSNQANSESRNLDTIRAGIKTLYGANSNYALPTPVSETVANRARVTPEAMRNAAAPNTITNSFGGEVTITPQNLGAGVGNGFRITYPQVPGGVCIKLATTGGAQFDQVTIDGAIVKTFGTNTLDPATAATRCNNDAGNGVTMLFDSL